MALIVGLLLSGCASTLDVLDDIRLGQTEIHALEAMRNAKPKCIFEDGSTQFLVYGYVATFFDMYDNTITYYFIKLKDGKVVGKGMLRTREKNEIKNLDPTFDPNSLIRQATKVER